MLQSFAPVVDQRSKVLVLGTMPGVASQTAQQYYAHPRNAFWPIMQALFAIDSAADYATRLALLLEQRIALWDVYAECERQGSLDKAIDQKNARTNSLVELLLRYPSLQTLVFNGKLAYQTFQRDQAKQIGDNKIKLLVMPSTSPANAALKFEQKLASWRAIVDARNE